MSTKVTLASTARSEWIKFRSIRSTVMGVALTAVLTIGIGLLITLTLRAHWGTLEPVRKLTFDPVSTSLGGTFFAQFAVGVIGALFITAEYTSGSIRTSLAAVPHRTTLALGKTLVLAASILVVSEVVCLTSFLIGQWIYAGIHVGASLSSGPVLRAVLLAGVYLTLLSVIGFALGLILRHSAACISVFVSLLLILPIILFLLPQSWQNDFQRFEPSNLGSSMMSVVPQANLFTAWPALGVLAIYVVVLLGVGIVVLERRDA